MTATVTRKGQVTIPKPMRDRLGLSPGSSVGFRLDGEGHVVMSKAPAAAPSSVFERLRGRLAGGPATDEVMALTRGE
ncbi:MAG: AbrB/MazE/SpoVT family DNA-binding domain-containing protein [Bosea sp.]|nr:AbrB/MazE/SpoVT family DNA-binding domain-containing protein [Bosea sp. (in: a-proteobacteria)]